MKRTMALIMSFSAAVMLSGRVAAAPKYPSSDKLLTRGEMAVMLSATDFMKQKISTLLDFATGYNLSTLNRSTLAPIIRGVRVVPYKVPSDGRIIFSLTASVDDPGGLSQITGVKADLTNIGRLSEVTLVDSGLWGDDRSDDGVYTLQTSTGPRTTPGAKEVSVSATNKQGWLSIAKTDIVVEKSHIFAVGISSPQSLVANGKNSAVFTVQISPPEKAAALKGISIDLREIGGPSGSAMKNDGTGADSRAGDNIFSIAVTPAAGTPPGEKALPFSAVNSRGEDIKGNIIINILR